MAGMKILRGSGRLDAEDRGASVAIGNFDGVHRGHQRILETAREAGGGAPLGVVTFEPHPRSFFSPGSPPFRLMSPAAKARQLERFGVQALYELAFGEALSGLGAEAFARDILSGKLGISHAVVGADFRFGKGREGTAETLRELGPRHGFGVTVAEIISGGHGELSSTGIRKALSEGAPERAAEMLGHHHRIEGEVVRGEQRGRRLGFPTANLLMEGLHLPRFGVYAVKADILAGAHAGSYGGAASIGTRPTFGGEAPNLEAHLFGFSGDLYGAEASIALISFIRDEVKYEGAEALVAQMEDDCRKCREILGSMTELSQARLP